MRRNTLVEQPPSVTYQVYIIYLVYIMYIHIYILCKTLIYIYIMYLVYIFWAENATSYRTTLVNHRNRGNEKACPIFSEPRLCVLSASVEIK